MSTAEGQPAVKSGTSTREVIARFESERQELALMDHPAIAKVLDAGSTLQGPYFVMEYVAGIPITAYCNNHRLSIRERLELFMPPGTASKIGALTIKGPGSQRLENNDDRYE